MYSNKVAWVTGASSGIGVEIVRQLDQAGARVILSSRNANKLEEIRLTLKNPDRHIVLALDLENSSNFEQLAAQVITKFGQIDFVFNNGGLSQRSEAGDTPLDVDRRIMEINYFGNVALTKAVLPYMREKQSGHFIVISSIAGKFGFFLRSAYSASKHALHGFYESLMLEEEANGIKVTIVCPGKINTNISVNALNETGQTHGQMDHNQETGMSAKECVSQLMSAVQNEKKEVLIGNKEIKAVTLKRFLPNLFWKVIRKQAAT
ncbi:MAG: SDR family oxidoreductase [Crocinitomicaceae bacterium]|nr:SDR family oxidoreductase [Crocinitomicaceae bacterium]